MFNKTLIVSATVGLISVMATPAFAACVTNANGDVFCYTTLPPMPPPKLEMMRADLPPPPGHEWKCTIVDGGSKMVAVRWWQ